MSARLTFADVVEHVAFETDRSVHEVLHARTAPEVWLRRLTVWLARRVGRLSRAEINAGLGRSFDASSQDLRHARRLSATDETFRQLASVVGDALVAL